jgi:hypothetical protein
VCSKRTNGSQKTYPNLGAALGANAEALARVAAMMASFILFDNNKGDIELWEEGKAEEANKRGASSVRGKKRRGAKARWLLFQKDLALTRLTYAVCHACQRSKIKEQANVPLSPLPMIP